MNRVFNSALALFVIFALGSSKLFGQIKKDDDMKKFAIGTEIDLLGALGLGFVNLTGSYYLSDNSFIKASSSIALQKDGSHYSVRYNYIFKRVRNWITGDEKSAEIYGIGGLSLLHVRDYFEEGEEGGVKWGLRSGNSANFVIPSVGFGVRGPFKLFGLIEKPNVWMDVFFSLPPTFIGAGIEYRF